MDPGSAFAAVFSGVTGQPRLQDCNFLLLLASPRLDCAAGATTADADVLSMQGQGARSGADSRV